MKETPNPSIGLMENTNIEPQPDIASSTIRRHTADALWKVLNTIDFAIDVTAEHIGDSVVHGIREGTYRLFHPRRKNKKSSTQQSL